MVGGIPKNGPRGGQYSKSTLKVINPSASFHSAPPLSGEARGEGIKDVEELSCAPWDGGEGHEVARGLFSSAFTIKKTPR